MSTAILIIDPQNDFMDSPDFEGSLAVPGAYQDTLRLCQHIQQNPPQAITVTLDTHQRYDISHALWWVNEKGEQPKPFTIISVSDVEKGVWKPYDSTEQEYALFYVKELAKKGNYPLCIWPYHVIKNSKGHEVEQNLKKTLDNWEATTGNKVVYVYKGMNSHTEHYSALKAEVELVDEDTHLNVSLINSLKKHDVIKIAGQAKSHCVAGTTIDLLDNIGSDYKGRVEILENCMSSVPGFESNGDKFISNAKNKGAIIINASLVSNKLKM